MNTVKTTAGDHGWQRKQMIEYATFTPEDKAQIAQCRGTHNRLGFAYQIAFARLMNRFPLEFRVCRQISGVLRSKNPVMTRVYSLHYGDFAQNL